MKLIIYIVTPLKKKIMKKIKKKSLRHLNLIKKSNGIFPSGTSNVTALPKGHEFIVKNGNGAYLYDIDGREFLDFSMGSGAILLGHASPIINRKINQEIKKGSQHYIINESAIKLSEKLINIFPSSEMMKFTSSGTESFFHAVRLARVETGREYIIKFKGSYHGHSDEAVWSIESGFNSKFKGIAESDGLLKNIGKTIYILPFNNIEVFKKFMQKNGRKIAAVICEPFQRMTAPCKGFLETIKRECKRSGSALIFDEVVTGLRFPSGSAQKYYGVMPDMTLIGKSLGGGIPMGALLGKRKFLKHMGTDFKDKGYSYHGGTFNGFHLGAELSLSMLNILFEGKGIDYLQNIGQTMREELTRVFFDNGLQSTSVIGDGPLFHPVFYKNNLNSNEEDKLISYRFHIELLNFGVLKSFKKGYLSLAHNKDDVEKMCDITKWIIKKKIRY